MTGESKGHGVQELWKQTSCPSTVQWRFLVQELILTWKKDLLVRHTPLTNSCTPLAPPGAANVKLKLEKNDLTTYFSIVPKSHFGSLLNGIFIP